jgi:hypothetical protein
MTSIEKLDIVVSSGRNLTLSEIVGAWREMFAEHPEREVLLRALDQHPGVVAEGITYRVDPVRRANWLVELFGLSAPDEARES